MRRKLFVIGTGFDKSHGLDTLYQDFYEYLKEKKKRQKDILWKNIQEDEPTNEEVEIINNYIQNDSNDTISLDDLAKDLGINE